MHPGVRPEGHGTTYEFLGLLGLEDLRAKVGEESTRNKFQVNAYADAGQGFSFTSPHQAAVVGRQEQLQQDPGS